MNIVRATAICLHKIPKIYEKFRKYFFRKMALADPIFTLDGEFQLFWAAFYMPVTVLPLKVALGLKKMSFGNLKKNNHTSARQVYVHDYFFEMPRNQICPIIMQLLMVPLSWAYQKLPKTIEPPI